MKENTKNIRLFSLLILAIVSFTNASGKKFVVSEDAPKTITPLYFSSVPSGGDTIYISSNRTLGLKFQKFYGNEGKPIVFINDGGQVNISDMSNWGALTFENCQYIKVTGSGSPNIKYGFKLAAQTSGLAFSEYSSDCESEFIEIDHSGFFGIYAKKDFGGNPPVPYPVFKNLIIHDMYISHVSEGMYLGETKSPGMEFRHVRIYNNIVKNTGREGIQVANMVEDVEVYNNVIINSGLGHEEYQSNNFQIGDNSVGKYYNNILIGAPALGMIVMGAGNIDIFNNYIEDNKGVFIDNRIFTTPYAPISFRNNYFLKTNNGSILTNYNELNPVIISANQYDGTSPLVSSSTASENNVKITNNQLIRLPKITFVDTINYIIDPNSVYKNMGPVASAIVKMNDWPILDSLKTSYFVEYGKTTEIKLMASVEDNDQLKFSIDSLPSFVSIVDSINGYSKIVLSPAKTDLGSYNLLITVSDKSHEATARQMIKATITSPNNHKPEIKPIQELSIQNLEETIIPIYVTDKDKDNLVLSLPDTFDFIKVKALNDTTFNLIIKPKYQETGDYRLKLSLTDSFSEAVTYTLPIHIEKTSVTANTPVYRLDCGGGVDIEMAGNELNWEHVRLNSGKQYVKTYCWETGCGAYDGINNTTAPNNVFGSICYDNPGDTELQWKFPVANGKYKVNLFFRERQVDFDENGDKSVFNISIENTEVLKNFSIFDESGENPLQKTFETVVKDQELNIDFFRLSGIPKISGIEIIFLESGNMPPVLSKINPVQMNEGDVLSIPLQITDDNSFVVTNSTVSVKNFPSFASLKFDTENNTASILLKPDYSNSGTYKSLLVKASDGEFTDSTYFDVIVNDKVKPSYPSWTLQNSVTMNEGETLTLTNIAFDPEGDAFTVAISGSEFTSVQKVSGSWNLILAPDYYSAGTYTLDLTATDENNYTSTFSVSVIVQNVNPQIILSPDMITDEVAGGSLDSPRYLVDEQNLTPENSGVPVSKSWKPAYNSDNAPFNVTIDLGAVYEVSKIALHDMNDVGRITVSVAENGLWHDLYSEQTNEYNDWKTREVKVYSRYIRLTFEAGSGAYINEIVLYGTKVLDDSVQVSSAYDKFNAVTAENTIKQIILAPEMITDEVTGGSLDSPRYLVDEQSLNIDKNEHATSKCWKPYYNSNNAPYNAIIDLGSEYVLKKIYFHDMFDVGPMIISYGEPGNWTTLYTENFDTFNNWISQDVEVQTRYIRLTLEGGSGANTNEIMVFGYSISSAVKEKSATIPLEISGNKNSVNTSLENNLIVDSNLDMSEIKVFPTLFSHDIHVQISDDADENYTISLFSSTGKIINEDRFVHFSITDKTYSTDQWNLAPGVYLMKIKKDNSSTPKTFKLIKT